MAVPDSTNDHNYILPSRMEELIRLKVFQDFNVSFYVCQNQQVRLTVKVFR